MYIWRGSVAQHQDKSLSFSYSAQSHFYSEFSSIFTGEKGKYIFPFLPSYSFICSYTYIPPVIIIKMKKVTIHCFVVGILCVRNYGENRKAQEKRWENGE